MIRKQALVALALCATPLLVLAQNTNTPGGQASTGTPIEQTKSSSQKPMATSPSGTGANGTSSTAGDGTAMKKKARAKAKDAPPAGDVPTYPAPARDGTPTK